MSIDAIGSTLSILYTNLCCGEEAHNPNPDEPLILESLYNPLRSFTSYISPTKNKIGFVVGKLKETHKLFHVVLKDIKDTHIPIFIKYLITCYRENRDSTDKTVAKSAARIAEFYAKTFEFMECVVSREYPAATLIMKNTFCNDCFEQYPTIRRMHDYTMLQAVYNDQIPLRSLVDASLGRTPNDREIDDFIGKLISQKTSSSILHGALNAIFDHALSFHVTKADQIDPKPLSLQRVEDLLEWHRDDLQDTFTDPDSHLLTQNDPTHIKWRESLKPGHKITTTVRKSVDGVPSTYLYEIILGEPVGPKTRGFDKHIYFAVEKMTQIPVPPEQCEGDFVNPLFPMALNNAEEQPVADCQNFLVWISSNCSRIGLSKERENQHVGPVPAQIHWIAHDGRFALVERLGMQLGSPEWAQVMHQAPYKKVIINWLSWLSWQRFSPIPCKYKNFRFDAQGTLRTTRLNVIQDFNVEELEKLAFKVACKDHQLFKEYMVKADFHSTNAFRIIIEAGLNTFHKEQFDLDLEIESFKPYDLTVKEKALAIQDKIEKRFNKMKKGKKLTEPELRALKQSILNQYKDSGAACMLLKEMLP